MSSRRQLGRRSLPSSRRQNLFAQPQVFGGYLDVLVRRNVFERALQAHFERWGKLDPFSVSLAPHVGQVLGLTRVHR